MLEKTLSFKTFQKRRELTPKKNQLIKEIDELYEQHFNEIMTLNSSYANLHNQKKKELKKLKKEWSRPRWWETPIVLVDWLIGLVFAIIVTIMHWILLFLSSPYGTIEIELGYWKLKREEISKYGINLGIWMNKRPVENMHEAQEWFWLKIWKPPKEFKDEYVAKQKTNHKNN